jgi:serine O-acetyltransferase
MLAELQDDLKVARKGWLSLIIALLLVRPLGAVLWIRIYCWLESHRLPTFVAYRALRHLYGLGMNHGCEIGGGLYLPHPFGVGFGAGTKVGKRASIYGMVRFLGARGEAPCVGDDLFAGDGARFVGGVSIGNHTSVGAGAIVTKSFGDNLVVAGNPAKVIRQRARKASGRAKEPKS